MNVYKMYIIVEITSPFGRTIQQLNLKKMPRTGKLYSEAGNVWKFRTMPREISNYTFYYAKTNRYR